MVEKPKYGGDRVLSGATEGTDSNYGSPVDISSLVLEFTRMNPGVVSDLEVHSVDLSERASYIRGGASQLKEIPKLSS